MTADVIEVPADTWAPVPMRWALVREGDIVLDPGGRPWAVTHSDPLGLRGVVIAPRLVQGERVRHVPVDPDEVVRVLIPLVEREAVLALREAGLGPRLIDRPRT